MAMVDTSPIARPRTRTDRLRDRFFIVLTANMAVLWVWGAWHVSQEYVLTPNSVRALVSLLMPATPANSSGGITTISKEAPAEDPIEQQKRIEHEIGAVEVIVYVWRQVMLGVACLLELTVLLAAIGRWYRPMHLTAAVAMLLATVATLVAMRLLMSPDYGGLDPLAWRTHVYVAGAQSAYPILLLIAFWRRPVRSR